MEKQEDSFDCRDVTALVLLLLAIESSAAFSRSAISLRHRGKNREARQTKDQQPRRVQNIKSAQVLLVNSTMMHTRLERKMQALPLRILGFHRYVLFRRWTLVPITMFETA